MCLNHPNIHVVSCLSSNDGKKHQKHLKILKLFASDRVFVFDSVISFTDSFK